MRAVSRLLASVQRSSQFLEAGAPTGLTGLPTHASPRSTLLYLYNNTLEKLKQFPEHSIYRQSTEALTKHRMSIIESVRPAGLEEWQKRAQAAMDQYPEAFRKIPLVSGGSNYNIVWKPSAIEEVHEDDVGDADYKGKVNLEGPRTEEERRNQGNELARDLIGEEASVPRIELEPALTVDQINDIESRIGAGLIEEVIQVAEGESILAQTLFDNNVWEDLEEKPQSNQWTYNERAPTSAT